MPALVPPDPPLRDGDLVLRPGTERDVAAIREIYSEPDIPPLIPEDSVR